MGGHAQRQILQGTECGKIGRLQSGAVGVHHRQLQVAVGGGAAVAGDVLEHRQHAAVGEARGDGSGDRGDLFRRLAIGAVADHGVGAADRHVGKRQAVDVDAERQKVGGDQPGAEPGGSEARRRARGRRARRRLRPGG